MPLTELATICGRLARDYRSEGIDLWYLLDRMRRSVVVEAMSRSALFKGVEGRDLVRLTTRMTVLSEDKPVNTRLPVTWVIFAGGIHVGIEALARALRENLDAAQAKPEIDDAVAAFIRPAGLGNDEAVAITSVMHALYDEMRE